MNLCLRPWTLIHGSRGRRPWLCLGWVALAVARGTLLGETDTPRPSPDVSQPKPKPSATRHATFTLPKLTLIRSVFVAPAPGGEGVDPFFPHLTPRAGSAPAEAAPPVVADVAAQLRLKGISGRAGHRLAIINAATLAEGEEAEVKTDAGPVRLRCLQIHNDRVSIQIGKERRELKLVPEG